MTIKQKIEAALQARGYAPALHASTKYDKWVKSGMRPLFVGPSGALRVGDSASKSSSLSDAPIHARLVTEGEAILTAQAKPTTDSITQKYA